MAGHLSDLALRGLMILLDRHAPAELTQATTAADTPGASVDARLEFLGSQLELLASDRQSKWTLFASLAGLEILAAGAFLALTTASKAPPEDLSPWIWAGVSLVQGLLFSYGLTLLIQIGISSYYARQVERQVTAILDHQGDDLPPAVSENVNTALVGHRRGLWQVRTIYLSVYATLGTLVFASAALAANQITVVPLKATVLSALVAIGVVDLHLSYKAVVRGADTWLLVKDQVMRELKEPFPYRPPPRTQRRLILYLFVPRPNDLLVKGVFLHLGAAIAGALVVADRDWSSTIRGAAISFLAFEFLMYQARYAFNDRLGMTEDANNPHATERGRLPTLDTRVRRHALWAMIALRALLAIGSTFLIESPRTRLYLFGALAATWMSAIAYERLRQSTRPARHLAYSGPAVLLYVVVGSSYAIRAGFGLYVGSSGEVTGWLLVATMTTFYFSGLGTVLMAWVLESTDYIGRRTGRAIADLIDPGLGTKNHILPLARSAGILSSEATKSPSALPSEMLSLRDERVLRSGTSLMQPWNLLMIPACISATLAGWMGAGYGHPAPHELIALAVAGIVTAVAATFKPDHAAAAVVIAFVVHGIALWAMGENPHNLFALAPLLAVVASYAATRNMNYIVSISLFANLRHLPARLAHRSIYAAQEILR